MRNFHCGIRAGIKLLIPNKSPRLLIALLLFHILLGQVTRQELWRIAEMHEYGMLSADASNPGSLVSREYIATMSSSIVTT